MDSSAIDAETVRTVEEFSVNVDADEGDTRRVSPRELAERFPGVDLNYARSFTGQIEGSDVSPEGEVWRGLMVAVLILLLVGTAAVIIGIIGIILIFLQIRKWWMSE